MGGLLSAQKSPSIRMAQKPKMVQEPVYIRGCIDI